MAIQSPQREHRPVTRVYLLTGDPRPQLYLLNEVSTPGSFRTFLSPSFPWAWEGMYQLPE